LAKFIAKRMINLLNKMSLFMKLVKND